MGRLKAQSPEKEPELKTVKELKTQLKALVAEAKKQGITFISADLEIKPEEKLFWTLEDFGPKEEWVEFIPIELPELKNFTMENEEGRRFFTLEVNSCRVWFETGARNKAPQAFVDTYNNLRDQSIANRKFRKTGREGAMWTSGGPNGQNTWIAQDAPTAWLDIDGRFINPNKDYILYKGVPVPIENVPMLKNGKIQGELESGSQVGRYAQPSEEPTPAWLKQWKKGTTLRNTETGGFEFVKVPQKRKTNANKKVTSTGS